MAPAGSGWHARTEGQLLQQFENAARPRPRAGPGPKLKGGDPVAKNEHPIRIRSRSRSRSRSCWFVCVLCCPVLCCAVLCCAVLVLLLGGASLTQALAWRCWAGLLGCPGLKTDSMNLV